MELGARAEAAHPDRSPRPTMERRARSRHGVASRGIATRRTHGAGPGRHRAERYPQREISA